VTSGETSLPFNVTVADVLSAPPILIGTRGTLFDALMLMRTHAVSGLPVVDDEGIVVGVISEKDLARVLSGASGFPEIRGLLDVLMVGLMAQANTGMQRLRQALEETRVEQVMSRPPIVVRPEAPLEFAIGAMGENSINRLPVVDGQRLLGIVTRHDLMRALVRFRSSPSAPPLPP